jgi:hypothetical protein
VTISPVEFLMCFGRGVMASLLDALSV